MLYYYRARWYHPEAGVFAERDPLEHVDGPSLYTAFAFNQLNMADPWGTTAAEPAVDELGRPRSSDSGSSLFSGLASALKEHGFQDYASLVRGYMQFMDGWVRAEGEAPDYLAELLTEIMTTVRPDAAGISIEGTGAFPFGGISLGGNLEMFRDEEKYSVALYGFETWHNWSKAELDKQGRVEAFLAPFGASGALIGGGTPVNAAWFRLARYSSPTPESWTGYFNAVGVGSAGLFWSSDWIGAEYPTAGWGIGAWTKPYFHMAPVGPWRDLVLRSAPNGSGCSTANGRA